MRTLPRRRCFIFLCSAIFALESFSQDSTKWITGMHGGVNASTIYGIPSLKENTNVNFQLTPGFIAGVFVQFKINSKFSLCAELNFEKKGVAAVAPSTNEIGEYIGDYHLKTTFNYFTLPLTFRYTLNCKKLKYYVQLGPYLGYLSDGQTRVKAIGEYPEMTFDEQMKYYQRMDFGLTAGIGLIVPLSKKLQLPVEVRNNLGMHRLAKGESYNNRDTYNESFAFIVGLEYSF